MKKFVFIAALAITTFAKAEDDIRNCLWENGSEIPVGTCQYLGSNLSQDDRNHMMSVIEARKKKEQDEHEAREAKRIAEETEKRKADDLAAQKAEEARVSYCKSMKHRNLTKKEKLSIKNAVNMLLKDPDSAKYKWMKMVYGSTNSNDYCGLVNAKNSYGGYVGYGIFYVSIKEGQAKHVLLNDEDDGAVAEICRAACYASFESAQF